jgi:hypothetical protein
MEAHKPLGCWGSHIFQTFSPQMVVRLFAYHAGRALPPPPERPNFRQRLSRFQGQKAAGRMGSIEKSSSLGIRIHDLAACSVVNQRIPEWNCWQDMLVQRSNSAIRARLCKSELREATPHLGHLCTDVLVTTCMHSFISLMKRLHTLLGDGEDSEQT